MERKLDKIILVIEDDNIVRENIFSLLTEEGYSVFSAKNGDEGIKTAKKVCPDLIICDIMMQGIDGYQVLKKLSLEESTKAIPFIFLTAKVEKEDIRTGMKLGADDYIFKPFDSDELLQSIASRLKRMETLKADFNPGKEPAGDEKYSIDDKLFIQVNGNPTLIYIKDIILISAEKQYCKIKMSDGKSYLLRKSISYWESILPDKKFLRIHRSTIINIDYLEKMETWFNSSFIVHLKNTEKPVIISRRYSTKLRGTLFK